MSVDPLEGLFQKSKEKARASAASKETPPITVETSMPITQSPLQKEEKEPIIEPLPLPDQPLAETETILEDEQVPRDERAFVRLLDDISAEYPWVPRSKIHQRALNKVFAQEVAGESLDMVEALQSVRIELAQEPPPRRPQEDLIMPPQHPAGIPIVAEPALPITPESAVTEPPETKLEEGLKEDLIPLPSLEEVVLEPVQVCPVCGLSKELCTCGKVTLAPRLTGEPALPDERRRPDALAKDDPKIVITIYGLKGDGKTMLCLALPGKIAALSFDNKTAKIWKYYYNSDPRIMVLNSVLFYDRSTQDKQLESSNKTVDFNIELLETIVKDFEPDWVLVDGFERFTRIAEMKMRFKEGLRPYQGISNLNVWKARRDYVAGLHQAAYKACKRGIIYTTYIKKDEIIIDGSLVTRKDVPRWFDVIMEETDVVIKAFSRLDQTGAAFWATVETSKHPLFKTGRTAEITDCYDPNVGLAALLNPEWLQKT